MAQFPPVTAEVDPTVNAKITAAIAAITASSIGAATPSDISTAVAAVTPASLGVPTTTDLANAVAPLASSASVTAAVAAINAGSLGVPTLTPAVAQTISPSADVTPLAVQASASQTTNLFEARNAAGSVGTSISSGGGQVNTGTIVATANTLTAQVWNVAQNGPQLIMGAASITANSRSASQIPFVAKGAASQASDIAQVQNSAAAVVASFSSGGGFYTASWIRSGISLASAQIQAQAGSAATIGLVLRGATSQTADFTQWQDSTGTVQARMTSAGLLALNGVRDSAQTGPTLDMQSNKVLVTARSATDAPFVVQGATSQTGDLTQWRDSTGAVKSSINSFGSALFRTATQFSTAALSVLAPSTTSEGVIVRGAASQTADLQQWQDSTAAVVGRVSSSGAQQILSNSTTVTPLLVKTPASFAGNFVDFQDSTATSKFSVNQSGTVNAVNMLASGALRGTNIQNSSGANIITLQIGSTKVLMAASAAGDTPLAVRATASQTGDLFRAENSGATALFSVQSSGYVQAAQGMTINNSLRLGAASGTQADSASGLGVLAMANAITAPSATPVGGGVLYVSGGALRFRGSAGTDTQIAAA